MTLPHGRVPQNSRTLDSIIRLYKNADGEVLAIQKVNVLVTQMSVPRVASGPQDQFERRYHRNAVIDTSLTKINRLDTQDREIASIWHIGNYDSYTEADGTIQQVVYLGTGDTNDLPVDLNLLPQIGDTI